MKGAFLFFVGLQLAVADPQLCAIKGIVTDALTNQRIHSPQPE
ncbi:MAG TPA: hypothetical protein VLM42_18090 [Bryobacteraceae bacterium]|nr:hypothetical protein [Bryobacteraceae bacterium]